MMIDRKKSALNNRGETAYRRRRRWSNLTLLGLECMERGVPHSLSVVDAQGQEVVAKVVD